MKNYILSFESGAVSEIIADSDSKAISIAFDLLGECYSDGIWCPDGQDDDGLPCKRLFFWPDTILSDDSNSDNAIAQLSTLGYVSSTGF